MSENTVIAIFVCAVCGCFALICCGWPKLFTININHYHNDKKDDK